MAYSIVEDNIDGPFPEEVKYEWKGFLHAEIYSETTRKPFEAGKAHINTFKYIAKHEKLESGGVRFNAETLPKAQEEHLNKPSISREELFHSLRENAAAFYENKTYTQTVKQNDRVKLSPENIRLESASKNEDVNTVHVSGRSFFDCCVCAFAQHLPLSLSPDHIWALIIYAFAKHVDENSEELRENFVKHGGKKRLLVETKPNFIMSAEKFPDTGATPEEWEEEIFPKFSEMIKEDIGVNIHASIISNFTTTSPTSLAVSEISLMSAMKNYFSTGMIWTFCGIPQFTLKGTEQDWISLRKRAESLGELMTKEFSEYWMPLLLPVLDKFVEAYKGNVHHGFWQTMVKLRATGRGSGEYSFISGWIQILYPYLSDDKVNSKLKPWNQLYFEGPRPVQIPNIISSVPVDWKTGKDVFDIHFHAGFTSFSQDEDGRLSPQLGWFVTHDPKSPASTSEKVEIIQKEIENILQAHKKEHKNGKFKEADYQKAWIMRVLELESRESKLMKKLKNENLKNAEKRKSLRPRLQVEYDYALL